MTPEQILMILSAVTDAAPKLLDLWKKANKGDKVSAADVQATLAQYGVDRAVLVASIARGEEEGR